MNSEWQPLNISKQGSLPDFAYIKFSNDLLATKSQSAKPLIRHESGFENSDSILQADPKILDLAKERAMDPMLSGYTHSCGMVPHRKGLAQKLSLPDCSLTENDIIFFTGEDMAINHIMRVFCNPGDNFIIPNPTLGYWVDSASGFGFECRQYKLLPEQDWQADLKDLRSKIDDKTKFILIMNPSYPTGGVHSEEHLREIIKIAEENTIPIVANEIYSEYLFKDSVASSVPKISGDVPVVQIGGIGKQFCVPGFRFSWIAFYDRIGAFKEFIPAFQNIMQLMLHPPPYLQSLVPDVFDKCDKNHVRKLMPSLENNYKASVEFIEKKISKHFKVCKANGGESFIALVQLDSFKDIQTEEELAKKLYSEQNVFVLPTTVFHSKGGIVISTSLPEKTNKDFLARLEEFCKQHEKQ